jgi:hypothetical protein
MLLSLPKQLISGSLHFLSTHCAGPTQTQRYASKPAKPVYFRVFAFLINALRWSDPNSVIRDTSACPQSILCIAYQRIALIRPKLTPPKLTPICQIHLPQLQLD